jgi:hypothetical protein
MNLNNIENKINIEIENKINIEISDDKLNIENKIKDIFCKICYNNNENTFLSCCLNKMCNDCYSKINKCPWCRTDIINNHEIKDYNENEFIFQEICINCENIPTNRLRFCESCDLLNILFYEDDLNENIDNIDNNFINNLD